MLTTEIRPNLTVLFECESSQEELWYRKLKLVQELKSLHPKVSYNEEWPTNAKFAEVLTMSDLKEAGQQFRRELDMYRVFTYDLEGPAQSPEGLLFLPLA